MLERGFSMRILVADDDAGVLDLMTLVLEEAGHEVRPAGDGREALRLLIEDSKVEIDLLLTDVAMPEMTGFALARAAAAFRPDLPILYTSGFVASSLGDEAVVPAPLLRKPFRPAQLLKAVEDCARARRT
jgi:CheY-like chemotaxis protein